MKDKIFGVLQRVGRSFMLPIAILPIAGLLLGIGSSFTNPTTLEAYHLTSVIYEGGIFYTILEIMSKTGSVVFDNLALLFAMGVAIGMAKKEKEVAALSGAISYLIMNTAISALISAKGGAQALPANSTASVLGITTLQMGVFGGIIVGLGVAALHNRFYKIELPQVLSFFGGTRFVPIVCSVVFLIVGSIMFFIWQPVQQGIAKLGTLVLESGYAGTWIYGITERALIPFGLHHVFYMPFWQTELGGSMIIDGNVVSGAQNIFFAELASKATERFSVSATRFMSGKFPFMIFGLPAAALAMYRAARPEKKKAVGGLLLSAALTSMITGITEPLEFTFLFAAPVMYGVHCILAGLSYMLMHIFGVGVGMTFSGGLIDLTLFGILQGNDKTSWVWIAVIGLIYAVVYYFVFYFMITKFNLKTPGREDDGTETKLYTRADYNKKNSDKTSELLLKGLGGKDNISDLDCCATRLRVTVKDVGITNEKLLKESGASGVIIKGNGIQVVFGPKVSVIKSALEEYIEIGQVNTVREETDIETNSEILYAFTDGNAIPLSEVKDDVFSEGILGKGCAVISDSGEIYSPCDGKIETMFDTKHAVNLTSNCGAKILIHVGIDTVKLNGRHFTSHVNNGDIVKAGEKLISFNDEAIKNEGFDTSVVMVICNCDEYSKVEQINFGRVIKYEDLIKLKK